MEIKLISKPIDGAQLCARAASTCTNEKPMNLGTKATQRILNFCRKSGHYSVFEHAVFTFEIIGISRACSHQLVRYRIASYSQQSQRYVNMDEFEFIIPDTIKNTSNGQTLSQYLAFMENSRKLYQQFTKIYGIPEEDARYALTNAVCTNLTVTMNARELMHFFEERCCNRAQWEIRELANKMLKLCQDAEPEIFKNCGPRCITSKCREVKPCNKKR